MITDPLPTIDQSPIEKTENKKWLLVVVLIVLALTIGSGAFLLSSTNQLPSPTSTDQSNQTTPPQPQPTVKLPSEQLIWSGPNDILSIDISPDGQQILLGIHEQGSYIIDTKSKKTVAVIPDLIGGSWSPDGQQLAFNGPWISENDGQQLRQLDQGGYDVSWSTDGQKLAYIKYESNSLMIMDIPTGKTEEVITAEGLNAKPVWSPDGKELLYSIGYIGGRWFAADLTKKTQVELTSDEDIASYVAAWSPDGQWVAYDQNNGINLVDHKGGNRRVLTKDGFTPKWSLDNQSIYYQTKDLDKEGLPTFLWQIDIDGQNKKQIGPIEGINLANQILWSPNDNQVFVSSKTKTDYTIKLYSWVN